MALPSQDGLQDEISVWFLGTRSPVSALLISVALPHGPPKRPTSQRPPFHVAPARPPSSESCVRPLVSLNISVIGMAQKLHHPSAFPHQAQQAEATLWAVTHPERSTHQGLSRPLTRSAHTSQCPGQKVPLPTGKPPPTGTHTHTHTHTDTPPLGNISLPPAYPGATAWDHQGSYS